MPGCAAVGCTNSAEKGFLMKKFPRDPLRRKQWVANMKRSDYTPTDSAALCEIHFAPEMWEKTKQDGSRKLKISAVPTIFINTENIFESSIQLEKQISSSSRFSQSTSPLEISDSSILSCDSSDTDDIIVQCDDDSVDIPVQSSSKSTYTRKQSSSMSSRISMKEKNEIFKRRSIKRLICLMEYRSKLRRARYRIKYLERQLRKMVPLKNKNAVKSIKFLKFDNDKFVKSLKLKFACGDSGYKELLRQNLPYPPVRALQRKLLNLKFECGILNEVFCFLQYKVDSFRESQRDCVLVIDEIAIAPGKVYDTRLNKYFGDVTLPYQGGTATHVLVFLLVGINVRWEQIVAYYFIDKFVTGTIINEIVFDILKKANEINLNIISITTHVGSCSDALWRTLGIRGGRNEIMKNAIRNPIDAGKKIFFLANVHNLFETLKTAFISNKVIIFPKFIQEEYNIPTNIVNASHLIELLELQSTLEFRLIPKSTQIDLMPSDFDTADISSESNIPVYDICSALKFAAEKTNKREYLTTAWFIDTCEKWFKIMTSMSPANCINKINTENYIKTIQFLNNFIEIISFAEMGWKQSWKSCQTGILVTTTSIIEIQEFVLETHRYEYILTGRFSYSCLEVLLSALHKVVPNAVHVRNSLKLMCVSQYLKCPKTPIFQEHDKQENSQDLQISLISCSKISHDAIEIPQNMSCNFNLNFSELNSLYNIAGYVVNRVKRLTRTCCKCLAALGTDRPPFRRFNTLSLLQPSKINTSFFCHEHIFYFFIEMERMFRQYYEFVSSLNVDLIEFYVDIMQGIECVISSDCHNIKYKIIRRFVIFRLNKARNNKSKLVQRYIRAESF